MPQSSPKLDSSDESAESPERGSAPVQKTLRVNDELSLLGFKDSGKRIAVRHILDWVDGDSAAGCALVRQFLERGWDKKAIGEVFAASDARLRDAGAKLFELQDVLEATLNQERKVAIETLIKRRALCKLTSEELVQRVDAAIATRDGDAVERLLEVGSRFIAEHSPEQLKERRLLLKKEGHDAAAEPELLCGGGGMTADDHSPEAIERKTFLVNAKHLDDVGRDMLGTALKAITQVLKYPLAVHGETLKSNITRLQQLRDLWHAYARSLGDAEESFVVDPNAKRARNDLYEQAYRINAERIREVLQFLQDGLGMDKQDARTLLRDFPELLAEQAQAFDVIFGLQKRYGLSVEDARQQLMLPNECVVLFEDLKRFNFAGRIEAYRKLQVDEARLGLTRDDLDPMRAWSRLYFPASVVQQRLAQLPVGAGRQNKKRALQTVFAPSQELKEYLSELSPKKP
jgi:hypothetical protein